MDNYHASNSDSSGPSIAQVIAFTSAAAVTAAVVGIAAYMYIRRISSSTPQAFLNRCQSAIDQIERGLDTAHA
jgi:hypothetical protein